MRIQETIKNKVVQQRQNCFVTVKNSKQVKILTVLWLQNKSIEFRFPKKKYNKKQNFLQQEEKDFIIQIDLNYSVQLNRKSIYQSQQQGYKKEKNKSQESVKLSFEIIIQNYKNNQQISIQYETLDLKYQYDHFYQYFYGVSWIRQSITQKYQIVREIQERQNDSKSNFVIIKDISTYQNYFAKKYSKRSLRNKQKTKIDFSLIIREVSFQNKVKHKNIMRFNYFLEDQQYLYLFYQDKPSRNLAKHITLSKELSSQKIQGITLQILKAIKAINLEGLLHQNLKLSSIFMIQQNRKWKVCLGQFQKASLIEQKSQDQNLKLQLFLAPQLIKQNEFYGERPENSDIFSIGVFFYELLFKKSLFNPKNLQDRVQNIEIDFQANYFKVLPQKCLDLLKKMIQYHPYDRLSAEQALKHEYFGQGPKQASDYVISGLSLTSTVKQFNQMISQVYRRKVDLQNQRVRDRYYSNVPMQNPLQKTLIYKMAQSLKFVQKFPCSTISSQCSAIISDYQMDDKHINLHPRDVRIMKPSWTNQRYKIDF